MSIKQIFKTFYNNLKSWGWYECIKYTMVICLLFIGFLINPIMPLLFFALAWLVIKDFRLSHFGVILISIFVTIFSLRYNDDFPQIKDIILWFLSLLSIICICKITIQKKEIRKAKHTDDTGNFLTISSLVIIGLYSCFILPFVATNAYYPDYEYQNYKECLKEKAAAGYPEEFVRDYCWEHGRWCGVMEYAEDCEPEHCCFMSIEEDKKWNYLDYDKNGNRIKK